MTATDVWDTLATRLDPLGWRPQLGDWVEVNAIEARGGRDAVMLGNQRDLVYYRLDPSEAALLALMDGERTIGDIVVDQLDGSGAFDVGEVAALAAQLHEGGFLTQRFVDVDGAMRRALEPRGPRAAFGRFLRTLSIQWSGAEQLTRRLYRSGTRVLFTRLGALAAALVAVGGVVAFVTVARSHDFDFAPTSPGLGVAILLALNLALIFVHELGHATYLVHHGRRVKGAGIRVYFGTPAFFVESSDVLMMKRRQRMLQSFAGPYFELIGSGIAAIALWAAPDSWAAPTLYRFIILNYFVLALNLVPLLELDGYWILSDAIRVPDLRPRSLAFVRHDAWHKLRNRSRFTSSDIGLGLYGTVGVVFTIFCLWSALFFWRATFGGLVSVMWDTGPVGVLLLVLLVLLLAGPLLRAAAQLLAGVARQVQRGAHRLRFRAQLRWRIEAAELLDRQPLFEDLPVAVLNDIAGRVQLRSVPAATAVVRQGDPADALYLVRNGALEVVAEHPDGTEHELHTIETGQSFGETGLATGATRNATVRTLRRTELFVIDKATFDRLLLEHVQLPDLGPSLQTLVELRALPPFSHLPVAEIERLREHGSWISFAPDATVITQGEAGDAFYVVDRGQLQVLRDGAPVAELNSGDHFGEAALLTRAPRNATVRTVTPARLFCLDQQAFQTLVADTFRHRGATNETVTFARE